MDEDKLAVIVVLLIFVCVIARGGLGSSSDDKRLRLLEARVKVLEEIAGE